MGLFDKVLAAFKRNPASSSKQPAPVPAPTPLGVSSGLLPSSYVPFPDAQGVRSAGVFDPALRNFKNALRPGRPEFSDSAQELQWRTARQRAMRHIVRAATSPDCADRLVLRGSAVLACWYPEVAREPGDLDFVVLDPTLSHGTSAGQQIIADFRAAVVANGPAGDVEFDTDGIAIDDIWTYERSPGYRLAIPWATPGFRGGAIQCDFGFGQEFFEPPTWTPFEVGPGEVVPIRTATRALSLAWKVFWLMEDSYAQGKDLYDAVLLAEDVRLPLHLLDQVVGEGTARQGIPAESLPLNLDVQWDEFLAEHPGVTGDAASWQSRLNAALAPTIAQLAARR